MIGSRIFAPIVTHPAVRTWLSGGGLPKPVHLLLGLVLPTYALLANMWHVHRFTVDDTYISFRYARNLADGLGLVYNPGERIEGYTNFLWTVILSAGIESGIDPHYTAKILGAASAVGVLVVAYMLANRLFPFKTFPCVATWLLASSSLFTGYAVYGLETAFFAFLVFGGMLLMFRENEKPSRFPYSGLVFATAGLTRPEAPLFIGLLMLLLGRRMFARQNIIRGLLFAAPLVVHILWRHSYYGEWLPATFTAKTGDMKHQFDRGTNYMVAYIKHAGPVVYLSLYGFGAAIAKRQSEGVAVGVITAAFCTYIMLVGGDWMPFFRFCAPIEPFLFVMTGLAIRQIVEYRDVGGNLAIAMFAIYVVWVRGDHLDNAQNTFMKKEKRFWDNAAGQTATWLVSHGQPGYVAIGDIGYVGYKTNYPILDLLGLVDPVIRELPGGYTKKLGKGFVERYYDVMPMYAVIILSGQNCQNPKMKGSALIYNDRRFKPNYNLVHNIQVNADASWCIFQRKTR